MERKIQPSKILYCGHHLFDGPKTELYASQMLCRSLVHLPDEGPAQTIINVEDYGILQFLA